MEIYELLYIIPLSVDPKESIAYYTEKIEEKSGQIIKVETFTGNNLEAQAKEKLEGCHILIECSIDKQYYSYLIECLNNDTNVIRHIVINVIDDKVNNKKQQEENTAPKCPFCGGDFHIKLCDEEGNPHSDDYLNDPYSGIFYYISHTCYDVPKGIECPIAKGDYSESIGCYLYESKEEAIAALKLNNGESL